MQLVKQLLIVTLFFFLSLTTAFAQSDSIKNLEKFTVETKYKPKLSDARKVEAYPEGAAPDNTPPVLSYDDLPQFKFKVPATYRQAPAIALKGDQPEELYDNFFRLGFGNYTTPLAEVYLNSLRNEKYSYGAHFKHLSSQGKPVNADFSDNVLGVYGKKEFSRGILSGRVDYNRNVFHYYGYADSLKYDKRAINQIFNDVAGNVHFDNVPEKQKIGTAFNFDFYNFTNLEANELDLKGSNDIRFKIKEGTFKMNTSLDYTNLNRDSLKLNRTFFNIFPSYRFEVKKIDITAGAKFTYFLDSAGGKAYPNAYINLQHYLVKDRLKVIAGLDGGYIKNSLRSLSRINPFLDGTPLVNNTFESYKLHFALHGALKTLLDFNIGISHAGLNNLPLYLIDSGEVTKFKTIYDNGSLFRFFGNLNFNINQNFKLWLNGSLYNYNMKKEDYAWQLPSFDMSMGMSLTVAKKLNLRLQTYMAGDRFQRIYQPTERAKKLAPYFDVNLLADYRYKKNVSFCMQINNVTNGRYQQWYNYPVFGLNGLLGVTFSL